MHFPSFLILATSITTCMAQTSVNQISSPSQGEKFILTGAGRNHFVVSWTSTRTTIPKVDIILYKGDNRQLIGYIAQDLTNTGNYRWATAPFIGDNQNWTRIESGTDYSLDILPAAANSDHNSNSQISSQELTSSSSQFELVVQPISNTRNIWRDMLLASDMAASTSSKAAAATQSSTIITTTATGSRSKTSTTLHSGSKIILSNMNPSTPTGIFNPSWTSSHTYSTSLYSVSFLPSNTTAISSTLVTSTSMGTSTVSGMSSNKSGATPIATAVSGAKKNAVVGAVLAISGLVLLA